MLLSYVRSVITTCITAATFHDKAEQSMLHFSAVAHHEHALLGKKKMTAVVF